MKITENVRWCVEDVRKTCIKHDLYYNGDVRAYDRVLNFVSENEPTPKNMYYVAQDISGHSEDANVEYIIHLLSNEACKRFYKVVEED